MDGMAIADPMRVCGRVNLHNTSGNDGLLVCAFEFDGRVSSNGCGLMSPMELLPLTYLCVTTLLDVIVIDVISGFGCLCRWYSICDADIDGLYRCQFPLQFVG